MGHRHTHLQELYKTVSTSYYFLQDCGALSEQVVGIKKVATVHKA